MFPLRRALPLITILVAIYIVTNCVTTAREITRNYDDLQVAASHHHEHGGGEEHHSHHHHEHGDHGHKGYKHLVVGIQTL